MVLEALRRAPWNSATIIRAAVLCLLTTSRLMIRVLVRSCVRDNDAAWSLA